ncbi:MAG: barstar family protein [Clostridiales bacterium]|jgi:ribonuclease inhibitor|nr:barstar family protein [Clostridiales bacterium]
MDIDKITIDFSGVKNFCDLHRVISESLDFPDWYGKNLDALWDLLTGYIGGGWEITLKGCDKIPKPLQEYMGKVVNIFLRAEKMYGQIKVFMEEL